MANVRNYEEYRAEVLDTLGVTVEDLRNEPSFRAKVLETLGVEFTDEDTRNFERYRLKALEGLKNGGGSGGGGGSGSGDLSTAEVTVINTRNEPVYIRGAFACDENELWEGSPNLSCYGVSFQENTTTSFRLVLYKGMSLIETDMTPISTSGSIQELDVNLYKVTGDCTITFGGVD